MSVDKFDCNNTADVEGEQFINENLDLDYLSALASDYVLLDTITDIDSDPVIVIDALT